MTIKSKQLFILIGDDKSGKTTIQKLLIEKILGWRYATLPVNKQFEITHPDIKRKYQTISFGNRSYQEKITDYQSIDNYFKNHFAQADIAFISSHLVSTDIQQMINCGQGLFYNVNGVFLTNSTEASLALNSQIAKLNWDERFVVQNPPTDNDESIQRQLDQIADNIVSLLISRTSVS